MTDLNGIRSGAGHQVSLTTIDQASNPVTQKKAADQVPELRGTIEAGATTQSTPKTRTFKTPKFDPQQPADTQILIAGAGIGGGPLARLAEQGFQTKFLEAGPPTRDWFGDVPLLHGRMSDTTFSVDGYSPPMAFLGYYVQHYEEILQKNPDVKMHEALHAILYPRGQGPGGSGNVNANVAVMPDRSTLEALYAQSGNDPRLHPDELLKYFSRAQNNTAVFAFLESVGYALTATRKAGVKDLALLSHEGWQRITRADPKLLLMDKQLLNIVFDIFKYTVDPKHTKFGDTVMRFLTLFDSNNPLNHGREGFTLMPTSITDDGRRSSVLDRIKTVLAARPDTLSVECETKVHSLILNKAGNRVEGVRVLQPNAEVRAQREKIYALHQKTPSVPADGIEAHNQALAKAVEELRHLEATTLPEMSIQRASSGYVLSAGAFEDPMILIRSGIGPKHVLDRLGIKPAGGVYREAVGANLKDRREITMLFHAKDKFDLLNGLKLGQNPHDDKAMKVWEESGRGPYGSNGVVASYQFKSDPSQPDADIFAFFVPVPFRGYVDGYSTDAGKYPQTFTAILLDKAGKIVSDDSRLMTKDEFAELRGKLGRVEPDANDPNHLKPAINFNFQRPQPGENPPLYSAMERMEDLFKGSSILTQLVPGNPFKEVPTGTLKGTLEHLNRADLFPAGPHGDIRDVMDWFKSVDVPVFDAAGQQGKLTFSRDGAPRLTLDGRAATEENLKNLTFFGGMKITGETLKTQLRREYLIEFQHSQQWGHHANGTCSMGPDPENNVVGSDYRVHGLENLWVASAAATPAAVNPGPFIQLYIAGAIGEVTADTIREQLVRTESELGRISPLASRLPTEISAKNTFAENLALHLDRCRGHVGNSDGTLTPEAFTALVAMHKKRGFSKEDLAFAEAVVERVGAKDKGGTLRLLADEVRKLRRAQSFARDLGVGLRALGRRLNSGEHLSNQEIVQMIGTLYDTPRPVQVPAATTVS